MQTDNIHGRNISYRSLVEIIVYHHHYSFIKFVTVYINYVERKETKTPFSVIIFQNSNDVNFYIYGDKISRFRDRRRVSEKAVKWYERHQSALQIQILLVVNPVQRTYDASLLASPREEFSASEETRHSLEGS